MKTQEAMKKLEKGVRDVFDGGKFEEWLECTARFHNYSFRNVFLIMSQMPGATRVAGYKTWQALGRQVRKGESGIRILAPCIAKAKEEGEPDRRYFRTVAVFDISQTDGEPLPTLSDEIKGDEYADTITEIAALIEAPVHFVEEGRAAGWYTLDTGEIFIKTDQDPNSQLGTLIHEWAHSLTYEKGQEYNAGEVIAEGTTYVVCSALGLDTGERSFGYIAGWSREQKLEVLMGVSDTIQKTAHAMLTAVRERGTLLAEVV